MTRAIGLLWLATLAGACHLVSGIDELEYVDSGSGGATSGPAAGGSAANNGAPCVAPTECVSNHCVDGFCCADACEAECSSCGLDGNEGVCSLHHAGTDPEEECSGSCDPTGMCVGAEAEFGRLFNDISVSDVAVGPGHAVYVVGSFNGSINLGGAQLMSSGVDMVVARYSDTGQHIWSKNFGGSGYDVAHGVAVDSQGSVWLTGRIGTTVDFGGGLTPFAGVFLLRLSANDGAHEWSTSYQLGEGWDIEAAGDGVLVLGTHEASFNIDGNHASPGVFLARFEAGGAPGWVRSYSTADVLDLPYWHRLAVSPNGDCAIIGGLRGGSLTFPNGTLTNSDTTETAVYLASVGSGGAYKWSKMFAIGDPAVNGYRDVAMDSAGNTFIAGGFFGNVDFGSGVLNAPGNESAIYVAGFDSSGRGLWSKSFGDAMTQEARAIAVDSADTLVVAGMAAGRLDFGGTVLTAGGSDFFLLRLTADGTHLFSAIYGDDAGQSGDVLAVDDRSLLVGGSCAGSIDFGDGWQMCPTAYTFVARFAP